MMGLRSIEASDRLSPPRKHHSLSFKTHFWDAQTYPMGTIELKRLRRSQIFARASSPSHTHDAHTGPLSKEEVKRALSPPETNRPTNARVAAKVLSKIAWLFLLLLTRGITWKRDGKASTDLTCSRERLPNKVYYVSNHRPRSIRGGDA